MNSMKEWHYVDLGKTEKKKKSGKACCYIIIFFSLHSFLVNFVQVCRGGRGILSHCSDTVLSKKTFLEIAKSSSGKTASSAKFTANGDRNNR